MIDLSEKLRHVPNFPQEGIDFIDITTVLQNPEYFHEAIEQLATLARKYEADLVIGSESRGFIMGAPLAYALKMGFAPVRKKGKLPYHTISRSYELEYGIDTLELHKDAISKGQRVLIVDDLLATGGTARANCQLVEDLGGEVVACLFFIELEGLNGRDKLEGYTIESICKIREEI